MLCAVCCVLCAVYYGLYNLYYVVSWGSAGALLELSWALLNPPGPPWALLGPPGFKSHPWRDPTPGGPQNRPQDAPRSSKSIPGGIQPQGAQNRPRTPSGAQIHPWRDPAPGKPKSSPGNPEELKIQPWRDPARGNPKSVPGGPQELKINPWMHRLCSPKLFIPCQTHSALRKKCIDSAPRSFPNPLKIHQDL